MAPIAVTSSDVEGCFVCFETFLTPISRGNIACVYTVCLYANWDAYVACNFNCRIKTEELLKVTGSHIHCKNGNISEVVQECKIERDIVATDRY